MIEGEEDPLPRSRARNKRVSVASLSGHERRRRRTLISSSCFKRSSAKGASSREKSVGSSSMLVAHVRPLSLTWAFLLTRGGGAVQRGLHRGVVHSAVIHMGCVHSKGIHRDVFTAGAFTGEFYTEVIHWGGGHKRGYN